MISPDDRHHVQCRNLQEAIPGMRPCKIVPAGVLEHGEDGRLVCWDDPALQPSCHIFYGAHTSTVHVACQHGNMSAPLLSMHLLWHQLAERQLPTGQSTPQLRPKTARVQLRRKAGACLTMSSAPCRHPHPGLRRRRRAKVVRILAALTHGSCRAQRWFTHHVLHMYNLPSLDTNGGAYCCAGRSSRTSPRASTAKALPWRSIPACDDVRVWSGRSWANEGNLHVQAH